MEKRLTVKEMEERSEKEGEIEAAITDDRPGKRDGITDEEQAEKGEDQTADRKARGGGWYGGGTQQGKCRKKRDRPDQEQLDGKEQVDGLSACSGERFVKTI